MDIAEHPDDRVVGFQVRGPDSLIVKLEMDSYMGLRDVQHEIEDAARQSIRANDFRIYH